MNKFSSLSLLPLPFLLLASFLASSVQALPDDSEQPVLVDADSSEALMNEGIIIYHGTPDKYATITQGSLIISGLEIRVQQQAGSARRMTATGNPASFQQQPALDREIVYGQANSVAFDHDDQLLVMEEAAELIWENNRLNGYYVEYDIEANRGRASSRDSEDRINMTIQPGAAQ